MRAEPDCRPSDVRHHLLPLDRGARFSLGGTGFPPLEVAADDDAIGRAARSQAAVTQLRWFLVRPADCGWFLSVQTWLHNFAGGRRT